MSLQLQRQIIDLQKQVERISTWDGAGASGGKQYATFVVAANDTTAAGKATADYVCDGTADQTEINSALSDATTSGYRRVLLLEGTYVLTGGITVEANDVLEGQGWASILQVDAGAPTTTNVVTLNNYSRIANLMIDGNAVTGTKRGVYADTKTGVQVEGLYIDDLNTRGILLAKCVQSIVTRNLVTNTTSVGIQLAGGNRNAVTGNESYRNSAGIYLGWSTQGETYTTVTGNNCYRNTYQIYLDECLYCNIVGNNCSGVLSTNGDYGIFVEEALYCTIASNVCNENSAAGIHLTFANHNLIQANICQGNSWSTSTNTGINQATGIRLDESDNNYITDNMVRISLDGGSEIQQYGIWIDDSNCDNNAVLSNDIRDGGNTTEFLDAGTNTFYRDYDGSTRRLSRTISTGSLSVPGEGYFSLLPETGTADNLDTITGGKDGMVIYLRNESAINTITLKDGTGNLDLQGIDIPLGATNVVQDLIYDETLAKWLAISCCAEGVAASGDPDPLGGRVHSGAFWFLPGT